MLLLKITLCIRQICWGMLVDFIGKNIRFLGFGLAMAFFSSFGQTYFIGVFREPIAAAYQLSNSEFGLYYLIITIGSAVGLNRLGHIIDRVPLRPYSLVLILASAFACAAVGLAGHFWLLMISLLCVRLIGQGLLTHAAMTSMSRYYDTRRGFAVALAGLGFPLGQALLPPLAVVLMTTMAWQQVWLMFAGGIALLAVPIVFWLLRGHEVRHAKWIEQEKHAETAVQANSSSQLRQHKRRRDVLRDVQFYFMLPVLVSGPFWITGVFFFASDIAAYKAFNVVDYTGFYGFYGLGSIAAPFVGGYLVDRFGGTRLMALYAPIFALGLAAVLTDFGAWSIIAFMVFLGFGAGVSLPINNAVWAEMYGTKYLGEIKSLATSLVVLSTALAPYIIGTLLDAGVALASILWAGVIYCSLAGLALFLQQTQSGPGAP